MLYKCFFVSHTVDSTQFIGYNLYTLKKIYINAFDFNHGLFHMKIKDNNIIHLFSIPSG